MLGVVWPNLNKGACVVGAAPIAGVVVVVVVDVVVVEGEPVAVPRLAPKREVVGAGAVVVVVSGPLAGVVKLPKLNGLN